jgi:hypothetical protein
VELLVDDDDGRAEHEAPLGWRGAELFDGERPAHGVLRDPDLRRRRDERVGVDAVGVDVNGVAVSERGRPPQHPPHGVSIEPRRHLHASRG